jgi:hypothetical protein
MQFFRSRKKGLFSLYFPGRAKKGHHAIKTKIIIITDLAKKQFLELVDECLNIERGNETKVQTHISQAFFQSSDLTLSEDAIRLLIFIFFLVTFFTTLFLLKAFFITVKLMGHK